MEKKKGRSVWIFSALILLVIAGTTWVKKTYFKTSYDQTLVELVHRINVSCPVMIDRDTRLDSACFLPKASVQYHYTMIRMERDSIHISDLKANLEEILLDAVCKNPELREYRDNNVTLIYHYNDKNGCFVTEIAITPEQYKK